MSICVWLGGLFYQHAIFPSAISKGWEQSNSIIRVLNRSFAIVSHGALGLLLITGVILMLSDSRFSLFSIQDRWSIFLLFKQIIFLLIAFFFYGYSRMLGYMGAPSSNGGFDERVLIYKQRIDQYQKLTILLGMTALIFDTGMHVYG